MVQTDKTFQTSSREILEGIGILQNVTVKHKNVDVILDFHVFDVQDFDLMIGHPIEKFLMDASTQGKLDVRLGKKTFRSKFPEQQNLWLNLPSTLNRSLR